MNLWHLCTDMIGSQRRPRQTLAGLGGRPIHLAATSLPWTDDWLQWSVFTQAVNASLPSPLHDKWLFLYEAFRPWHHGAHTTHLPWLKSRGWAGRNHHSLKMKAVQGQQEWGLWVVGWCLFVISFTFPTCTYQYLAKLYFAKILCWPGTSCSKGYWVTDQNIEGCL